MEPIIPSCRTIFGSLLGKLAGVSLMLAPFITCWSAPMSDRYVEGELLVKFKGGPRGEAAVQAKRNYKHEVKKNFDRVGWQQVKLPAGEGVGEAIERFRRNPDVLAVEPNCVLNVHGFGDCSGIVPNDPKFTSSQWALARIGATNAWCISTGSNNVVVAVIDSGVAYNHEDLAANMWHNPQEIPGNGIDDDGNGYIDDVYGIDVIGRDSDPMDGWYSITTHGTVAAGIVGAVGNNGVGIAGVNWTVQLMALRLLSPTGAGVTPAMYVELCDYILDQKSRGVNVRVTSSSWGFDGYPGPAVQDAVRALGEAGIINVFAAGQQLCGISGWTTNLDMAPLVFPQSWHVTNTINVAGSDKNDDLSFDSNWGQNTVDLAAPDVDIASVQGTGNYYTGLTGTSVACPFVSGAAALLAAAHPLANAAQIKTALILSADTVGNLTNKVAAKGRLNIARAISHPGLATNAPPFIYVQPQSTTNGVGCSAAFLALASGPSGFPLNYQWLHNGIAIENATNASLVLSSAGVEDSGDYQLVVSNEFGLAYSEVVSLTLEVAPIIMSQPQNLRTVDGGEVSVSVSAAGAYPLSYQWQRNGIDIQGANGSKLTLPNAVTNDSGNYQVIVSNSYGSVTSTVSTLTILGMPWVVAPPQSLTVTQGANISFCVEFTNTASQPVNVRWTRPLASSWLLLRNQFSTSTNILNVQTNVAGTWKAELNNAATKATCTANFPSRNAYLTVVIPPTNQTVLPGGTASFNVTAAGTAPLTYQWQFQGVNLTNQTNVTLVLTNVSFWQAGTYTAIVRNAAGEPTGFSAHLNVPMQLEWCPIGPLEKCVQICWPTNCVLLYSTDPDPSADWQPWQGPTSIGDSRCASIPVTNSMMFFKLNCQ